VHAYKKIRKLMYVIIVFNPFFFANVFIQYLNKEELYILEACNWRQPTGNCESRPPSKGVRTGLRGCGGVLLRATWWISRTFSASNEFLHDFRREVWLCAWISSIEPRFCWWFSPILSGLHWWLDSLAPFSIHLILILSNCESKSEYSRYFLQLFSVKYNK